MKEASILLFALWSNSLTDGEFSPSTQYSNNSTLFLHKFYPISVTSIPNHGIQSSGNIIEVEKRLLKNIGDASDLNELQEMLGIDVSPDEKSKLRSINTDGYIENPQQCRCEPELHSIDLGLQNSGSLIHYPTCTKVKRCGGRCPSSGFKTCQPTNSSKVIIRVLKLDSAPKDNALRRVPTGARGRGRRESTPMQVNYINATIEEHKECACLCRTREADCNLDVHYYDRDICSCICKNRDEKEKCLNSGDHHWNKDDCSCVCRKTTPCSSSEVFDHATCSCVAPKIHVEFHDIFLRKPWRVLDRY